MPKIGGDGVGGALPAGGVSTGEIMKLVYATGTSVDTTDLLDLAGLNRQQLRNLQSALTDAGEALTDEEKESFERGQTDHIKTTLKRIRQRAVDKARTAEKAESQPPPAAGPQDGLTGSRIPAPRPEVAKHLPTKDLASAAEVFHLIYESPAHADRTMLDQVEGWTPDQIRELAVALGRRGEKLSASELQALSKNDRAAIKDLLLRILDKRVHRDQTFVGKQARQGRIAGFGLLKIGRTITADKTLARARQDLITSISDPAASSRAATGSDKLLGKAFQQITFKEGFPTGGRSGDANTFPVIQLLTGAYQKTARGLGIQTLVDFLVRVMSPEPRLKCARLFGISTPTLLLAAHRAELLDLPINSAKAKSPHLKDILLLARLGANTVRALGQLGVLFDRSPAKLDLIAELIADLQKGSPKLIGRERLTRHELREWAMAAGRRGSHIEISETPVAGHTEVELAAERVLSWYLHQRFDDPEGVWFEMLSRLLILMRIEGLSVADAHWKRMLVECGQQRVVNLMQLAERQATELDRTRREAEMSRYEQYLLAAQDDDFSLFTALAPLLGPDAERQDRLICFWMDPVADSRHVVRTDGGGLPESLKQVYVCMDPDSGAIIPFGG